MSDKEQFLSIPLTVEKTIDIMSSLGIGFPLDVYEQTKVYKPERKGEKATYQRSDGSYMKVESLEDLKTISPSLYVTRIGKKGASRYIDVSRKEKMRFTSLELKKFTDNDITSLILAQKKLNHPVLTDKELSAMIEQRIR